MKKNFKAFYLDALAEEFNSSESDQQIFDLLAGHVSTKPCRPAYVASLSNQAKEQYFVPPGLDEEVPAVVLQVVATALHANNKAGLKDKITKQLFKPRPRAAPANLLDREKVITSMLDKVAAMFEMGDEFNNKECAWLLGYVGMPGSGKTACLLSLLGRIPAKCPLVGTLYITMNERFGPILAAICPTSLSAEHFATTALKASILWMLSGEKLFSDTSLIDVTAQMDLFSLEEVFELTRSILGAQQLCVALDEPLKLRALWLRTHPRTNIGPDAMLLSICCNYMQGTPKGSRVIFVFSSLKDELFQTEKTLSSRIMVIIPMTNLPLGPAFFFLEQIITKNPLHFHLITNEFMALFIAAGGHARSIYVFFAQYLQGTITKTDWLSGVAGCFKNDDANDILLADLDLVKATFRGTLRITQRSQLEELGILGRALQSEPMTTAKGEKRSRADPELQPQREIISTIALRSFVDSPARVTKDYPAFIQKLQAFYMWDGKCSDGLGNELAAQSAILTYLWLAVSAWSGETVTLRTLFAGSFMDKDIGDIKVHLFPALQVIIPHDLGWKDVPEIQPEHYTLTDTLFVSMKPTEKGIEAILCLAKCDCDSPGIVVLAVQVKYFGRKSGASWHMWKEKIHDVHPGAIPLLLTTCAVETPLEASYHQAILFTAVTLRDWMLPVGECCLNLAKGTRPEEFTWLSV